eukprot:Nitzschia sp. Nitz4//scaffold135_size62275//27974//28695//NITZ4_006350-RA/size62275-augustus-gene-0.1-mRNA-1//1//CDS//3329535563//6099//frame0
MFKDDILDFQVAHAVDMCWNKIKTVPNYELLFGEKLFRKVFELEPNAVHMYSFDGVTTTEEMFQCDGFKEHAILVVRCLDQIVNMLGPDLEPFLEEVSDMGARHVSYGVIPEHYPIFEDALLHTLGNALGKDWTEENERNWRIVYGLISNAMLSGAELQVKNHMYSDDAQEVAAEAKERFLRYLQPEKSFHS